MRVDDRARTIVREGEDLGCRVPPRTGRIGERRQQGLELVLGGVLDARPAGADQRHAAQRSRIVGGDRFVDLDRLVAATGVHQGAGFRQARHLGIAMGGVLGDDGEGRVGATEIAGFRQVLRCDQGLGRLDPLVRLIALPQLEAGNGDDDEGHRRDHIVAVLLPELFEAFAADFLLDFAEDVAH